MPSFLQHCRTPICADVLRPRALGLTLVGIGTAQLTAGAVGWGLPCFFHQWTGVPCPGCGLTRSVLALLRGHVWESVLLHPFGPVALLALAVCLGTSLMPDRWREVVFRWVGAVEQKTAPAFWGVVLLMLVWGLRVTGAVHLAPV